MPDKRFSHSITSQSSPRNAEKENLENQDYKKLPKIRLAKINQHPQSPLLRNCNVKLFVPIIATSIDVSTFKKNSKPFSTLTATVKEPAKCSKAVRRSTDYSSQIIFIHD